MAILAVLTSSNPNVPPSTIIIEQFRPPVNAYVIELPAGLIDPKDTIESAAFRELEEETGYTAESVMDISELMVCDPGRHYFGTIRFRKLFGYFHDYL